MTKKKILIIGVILIIILGLILILNKSNQNISNNPVPLPLIPSQTDGNLNISSNIKESEFKVPNALALIEKLQDQPINETEANSIAKNFGFSGDVIKTQDTKGGQTYIWSSDKDSLVIYSKTRQIDYSLNNISTAANKQLSDKDITAIAQNFLGKIGFGLDKASFSNFIYLSLNDETVKPTSKENANIYQVNFSPIQLDYKFLSINPQQSPIYVSVLKDGTVAKAHIVLLGNLSKSNLNYPIKNYEQFKNSLSKAILINIDDGNLSVSDINIQNITNVDVQKSEIVYLLDDNNSSFYQPVFYLTGTIEIKGYPSKLGAQLYLPALANQ